MGTPSGITLAPEGGAHQSMITPSIGVELPDVSYYEPCFGQELEWIMLHALRLVRDREKSAYLRLTSKRVDQEIFNMPSDIDARESLRRQVLSGAYRLIDRSNESEYQPGVNTVHLVTSGAIVPEAVEASRLLLEEGLYANVINITGPGPLFTRYQQSVQDSMNMQAGIREFMADVIPVNARAAPVVTVADAHPHMLSWIGSALGTRALPLGVMGFGQSGNSHDLYEEYKIDVNSIMSACFAALEI